MKSNYYYFIASLPHLSFSLAKPFSFEHFLSLCASFLHPEDFNIIKSISLPLIGDEASHLKTMKKWKAWDSTFRRELALLRAARLGRELATEDVGVSSHKAHAELVAKEVFAISSPLDADEQIDRARWEYVESLEFGRYFDIEWLALFSIKLHILERRETFDKEEGLQRLHKMMINAEENYEVKPSPVEAGLG